MGFLDFIHVVVLPVQSFVYTAPAITSDQDELITTDQARLRLHLSSGEDLKAASITSTPACFVSCSKLRAELGGRARSRVDDLRRAIISSTEMLVVMSVHALCGEALRHETVRSLECTDRELFRYQRQMQATSHVYRL